MKNIINKFLSAVFTAILFCIGLAIIGYVPLDQREENVYYFGFFELLMIYLIYAVPFTIIVGIPFSLVIEFVSTRLPCKSGLQRYLINVLFFTLAGIVITWWFLSIDERKVSIAELFNYKLYLFCVIPSVLFYHVSLVLTFLLRKFFRQSTFE